MISKIGVTVAVLAFVVFLVHDILVNPIWQTNHYLDMLEVVLRYFMFSVTIIVMAGPGRVAKAGALSSAQERELKKKKEAEDRRRAREKERLENLIETLEARISDMEAKMCEPEYLSDHVKLAEMSKKLNDMKTELNDTYDKWAEL